MICLFIGLVAGAIAALFGPWQIAVPLVWDVAAAVFLVWVWSEIHHFGSEETRARARLEDPSKRSARLILLTASVTSLASVALALMKAQQSGGLETFMLTLVAVLTVALSWGSVHTVFTLRYAHLYYEEPQGGIDFKSKTETDPDFRDFAYVAFTIGMTFQVSDTDIQKRRIRRSVLGHAMLSYLFGTVIVAVTINVLAGLVNK
ncbi:MAG: hypothetical protein JWL73_1920 [Actinomycetia bacterium]|nr:hypothetical protein [Actinomycetes bacterium]